MPAILYTDKDYPNACIFGHRLYGGRRKSNPKGSGYYVIDDFECYVFTESKKENKKLVLAAQSGIYNPLDGDLSATLRGSRGFLEDVEKPFNLELIGRHNVQKYKGHNPSFLATGRAVLCHFEEIARKQPQVSKYEVELQGPLRANEIEVREAVERVSNQSEPNLI
ncbi:MAG: hypothetical protein KGH94_05285 [Candidatus Micrarchaeota archaeon]|nr:hypothetical protein [Candidatus Micrarchaeota archaeon]